MFRSSLLPTLFIFLIVSSSIPSTTGAVTLPSCALQPLSAMEIEYFVSEPSGITFCNATGTLFVISDSDHAIFEISTQGQLIRTIRLDKKSGNIEGVACDSDRKLLFVTDEKTGRVLSFKLGQYKTINGEEYGILTNSLIVNVPGAKESNSGLEGITFDPLTNHLILANEKKPRMILETKQSGVILSTYSPDYCEDISDLEYESSSQILWVVSDQSELLLATDRWTGQILDSWNVPLRNSEGIAVTESHIYIVSDPSSPHGIEYVGGLMMFDKPKIGTGLQSGTCQGSEISTEECIGCEKFFDHVKINKMEYYEEEEEERKEHELKLVAISTVSVFGVGSFVLLFAVFAFILVIVRRKLRNRKASSGDASPEGFVTPSHSVPSVEIDLVV